MTNERKVRTTVNFIVTDDEDDDVEPGLYTPATGTTTTATYTVHDRVSIVDGVGTKWKLKGNSGYSTRAADNANAPVLSNTVSMYRKRSTNATQDGYLYKDSKPDGDKFGDGTKEDQWIESGGRYNMDGYFIGTPGAVHRTVGGRTVLTKTPASLPIGTVLINEIYNSDDLQWIELHNTGTAEVDVKKHELEAAFVADDKNTLQRVFFNS